MLSREEVYTMLMLRNREDTLFSTLPKELIIQEINGYVQALDSKIAMALHYAAYARQEDVTALLAMLDKNPALLLLRGNVKTPGGDEIRGVTIYEFLLGAGDYELAKKVQGYFSKIENGEQQKSCQYERYKPHIEGMLTQKPYDLTGLINLIKQASAEDVIALLSNDIIRKSDLCTAIIQFHKDWAPRILIKPCMHYNYASLQHAVDILHREWDNLYVASKNNHLKIHLMWRLLVGFEMRRLPGIDRCLMAEGLHSLLQENSSPRRKYQFTKGNGDFPTSLNDDFLGGLGWNFAVDIFGEARPFVDEKVAFLLRGGRGAGAPLEDLCRTKTLNLQNLCSHTESVVSNVLR